MSGKQCGFKNVDPNQMASFQMKPSDQDANCYLKEDTLIQMASLEYLLLKQFTHFCNGALIKGENFFQGVYFIQRLKGRNFI